MANDPDPDNWDDVDDAEEPLFTWNAPARCRDCGRGSVDPLSVAVNGETCPLTGAAHRWANDDTVWNEVGTDDD